MNSGTNDRNTKLYKGEEVKSGSYRVLSFAFVRKRYYTKKGREYRKKNRKQIIESVSLGVGERDITKERKVKEREK